MRFYWLLNPSGPWSTTNINFGSKQTFIQLPLDSGCTAVAGGWGASLAKRLTLFWLETGISPRTHWNLAFPKNSCYFHWHLLQLVARSHVTGKSGKQWCIWYGLLVWKSQFLIARNIELPENWTAAFQGADQLQNMQNLSLQNYI